MRVKMSSASKRDAILRRCGHGPEWTRHGFCGSCCNHCYETAEREAKAILAETEAESSLSYFDATRDHSINMTAREAIVSALTRFIEQ